MAFLALMLHGVLSQSPQVQAEALRTAKETVVRAIDSTLPAITLELWLQQQLGPGVEIAWEVNDCGEATGSSADNGRDLPFCVEASAQLREGRNLTLAFFAGTDKTGLSNAPIRLYYGALSIRGGADTLHALRDLPKLLKAHQLELRLHAMGTAAHAYHLIPGASSGGALGSHPKSRAMAITPTKIRAAIH